MAEQEAGADPRVVVYGIDSNEWDRRLDGIDEKLRYLVDVAGCGHDLERIERQADELRDKRNDLLNIRGLLSPNGYPQVVPMDLGDTVAPAVEWLIGERDRLAAELAEVRAALTDGLTGYERDRLAKPGAAAPYIRALRAALLATTGASSRLAETVRRYEPVIEAAKAWLTWLADDPDIDGAERNLAAAVVALGGTPDAAQPNPYRAASIMLHYPRIAAERAVVDAAKAWRAMRLGTPTQPKPEALALIQAVDGLVASPGDAQTGQRDEAESSPLRRAALAMAEVHETGWHILTRRAILAAWVESRTRGVSSRDNDAIAGAAVTGFRYRLTEWANEPAGTETGDADGR